MKKRSDDGRSRLLARRALGGLAVITSFVTFGFSTPASACADWLSTDRGQLGLISVPTINTVELQPADTLYVSGDRDAFHIDADGTVLRDLESNRLFIRDVPYLDTGSLVVGQNYYVFAADAVEDTVPLSIDGTTYAHPTVGFAYQHSTWDLQLRRPDGTPNLGFNGTGQIYLDPARGDVNPAFRFERLQTFPTTAGSMLVLGVWRDGVVPGSVLQLIEVGPDGTQTILAEESEEQWRITSIDDARSVSDGWEFEINEWIWVQTGDDLSRSRMIRVNPTAGTFTTVEFNPIPASYLAEDGRATGSFATATAFGSSTRPAIIPWCLGPREVSG